MVVVIAPDGTVVDTFPSSDGHGPRLTRPMAIAADSKGNMWVANSDTVDIPCPPPPDDLGDSTSPSIALYLASREPHPDSPFTGGGLTIPWGMSVDGCDTVWVGNFGVTRNFDGEGLPSSLLSRVSHFCGLDPSKCPLGLGVGDPISPDTGYTSDALTRITTTAIDPSGNVWVTNNWKDVPVQNNPGGNSIAVMIGGACPIKTPLIGPPVPFRGHRHW
jgi:hypothetical protein